MKKFLSDYQDWILGVIGALCFAALAGYMLWTLAKVAALVGKSIIPSSSQAGSIGFDLRGAEETLKGIPRNE